MNKGSLHIENQRCFIKIDFDFDESNAVCLYFSIFTFQFSEHMHDVSWYSDRLYLFQFSGVLSATDAQQRGFTSSIRRIPGESCVWQFWRLVLNFRLI